MYKYPKAVMLPPKEQKSSALFHYTDGNGVLGILSGSCLWLSDIECSNDHAELMYGRQALVEILQKYKNEKVYEEGSIFKEALHMGGEVDHFPEGYADLIYHTIPNAIGIYTFCLCRHSDDKAFIHGLLSQWRGYGSDGGYAIQFDSKKLRKILREFDKNENGLDITIDKIQYGVKGKYLKKLIQFEGELNSHFDAHVRRMYKFITGEYAVLKDYSVELLEALAWWMTFSKSHHFSEELSGESLATRRRMEAVE